MRNSRASESRSKNACLCRAQPRMPKVSKKFAEIAQLVEHNLAKVRVASSSLVFRSKKVLHVRHWKGGRVVDYSGLENRRAERHRGFESLPFRREASSESCSLFLF